MSRHQARGGMRKRGRAAACLAAPGLLLGALCLAALPAQAGAAAPVKLALFSFELEDFSAGAAPAGSEASADARYLAQATDDVRQLLSRSGRYSLVDVGGADAPAVKTHALHDCDGCDAAVARALGADQSFVGVVRRISRTEYMVRFEVRDARSGAVVAAAKSGLRMGADYSWNRGAVRLVEDRLLAPADAR
jgi:Protein of unknown function (DUF2380)